MSRIDLDVAMEQFKLRKARNEGTQIDNSRLVAGSPMYYYCRLCGELIDTLPELSSARPRTMCIPCRVLHEHGLI